MSDMAAWINELGNRIATGRPVMTAPVETSTPTPTSNVERTRETSGGEPPVTTPPITTTSPPAATEPPPAAGTPTSPVSADLRGWLNNFIWSNGELNDDLFAAHSDQILTEVRKFDPNARWVMKTAGGPAGESGYMQSPTYALDFDRAKLPTVGGPGGGRTIFDTGFVPVYEDSKLFNPELVYEDPYYGKLTVQGNVKKEKDPWWVYAAPLAVSLVAPWAAGLAAGAGVGGAAGLTAAATGSGLSAAQGAAPWWANALRGAPNVAKQVASGNFNPYGFAAGLGADALGIPASLSRPAITVGSELLNRPRNDGYNPQNYNNTGSAPKSGSNESALVANDFATDPYGFSKGTA